MMKYLLISTFLVATTQLSLKGQQSNAVGVANLTENTLAEAKSYARVKSEDCIVVLYCGQDMENAKEVIRGAQQAKDGGVNVRGVVIAAPDPDYTEGSESFTIYAHGVCLDEKPKDATFRPEWLIREVLFIVHKKVINDAD